MVKQKIALALSTGAARGIAHIGAIEELESYGFEIASIAGSSMGALIGATHATGNLNRCKQVFEKMTKRNLLKLVDISFSGNGFLRGRKIMKAFGDIIPDCLIEEIPIPFAVTATNVLNSQEVVLDSGSLHDAVRASISLPMIFQPVRKNEMMLIDGGIVNPLPLNRVKRREGDLLVGIVVSAPGGTSPYNRLNLMKESSMLMIHNLIKNSIEKYQPDLIIKIPAVNFGIHEFHQAQGIIEEGRKETRMAIKRIF